jgi:hypothetical protein
MEVTIRDQHALRSLSALHLRAYLSAQGWIDDGPWGRGRANLFVSESRGRSWDIIVPNLDSTRDHSIRMAEAVATLSSVEERSQLEIYYEIAGAGADVIRIQARNHDAATFVSIRESAGLLNDTYALLTAAARAAEKTRPVFRGPMSAEVAQFLNNVQPMPNYFDGYSLAVRSPVPAGIGRQQDMGDNFYAPFSRRATLQFSRALESATTAVMETVAIDSLEPFAQAVDSGVSANFCSALASLAEKGSGIEVDLRWARTRPADPSEVSFPFANTVAEILKSAASDLRRNEPPSPDEHIIGQIVRLDRELPHQFDGNADLVTIRDDRSVRMKVRFADPDFEKIITAFTDGVPVSLFGEVRRSGNGFTLNDPYNVTLTPDELG